jgi:hypothetical protein
MLAPRGAKLPANSPERTTDDFWQCRCTRPGADRSLDWPNRKDFPVNTSPGTCQGFMGVRPAGRKRHDAGHTANRASCRLGKREGEVKTLQSTHIRSDSNTNQVC